MCVCVWGGGGGGFRWTILPFECTGTFISETQFIRKVYLHLGSSTTRFANTVRFVFINLRADYTAVRQCLKNVIESKRNSSNAEERAKAGAVKTVLRVINSWVFCLCLAGCADIYNLYGQLANVCQQVDILPRERYDPANAMLSKFVK